MGSEGGCLLRAVLITLSLVWFLPWTDVSSVVTSHVSLEGQSHGTPCFTTYHAFSLQISLRFLLQTEIVHLLFAGIYKDGGSAGTYVCRVPLHTIDTQQVVLDCMLYFLI